MREEAQMADREDLQRLIKKLKEVKGAEEFRSLKSEVDAVIGEMTKAEAEGQFGADLVAEYLQVAEEAADRVISSATGKEKDFLDYLPEILTMVEMFLPVGEKVIQEAGPTLVKIIKLALKAGIDVYKDLEEERREMMKLGAKALYEKYDALDKAGFGKVNALKLIMAGIKLESIAKNVANDVVSALGKISK